MTADQLRQKYLDFFVARGHKIIPSAPLVPENDPSVLYTTAGMHPLVPYLLGQPHPLGKRLVDIQKCMRTDDIDEVGDTFHHTFFEMLGNWSLGDYFKKESITWSYEFLTRELKLDSGRLYISCFAGDEDAPKDEESAAVWQSLGIPADRIFFYGKKDNWWGPAGLTGPCGPDSEMFYDITQTPCGPDCFPGDNCSRFSEIWNNVFMEYNKTGPGKFEKLPFPNVDTGMGVERTLAVINGYADDYLTHLWQPAISLLEKLTGNSYSTRFRDFRIIADHLRAAVFIISDGVQPSNKERGYILRRLIRRVAVKLKSLTPDITTTASRLSLLYVDQMSPVYPELAVNSALTQQTLADEISRFLKTLDKGLREFEKIEKIDGKTAFDLFQTYGFPLEITAELASAKGYNIDTREFTSEFKKHQEMSHTASAGMFKGGLQDQSGTVVKYHTATHLLHQALRDVLGDHVHQKGSNITSARLRFDFSHSARITPEELIRIEEKVNQKISVDLPVTRTEMPKDQALAQGALAFFPEKYPETTSVYQIGDYSLELCGGPHVSSTGQIGRIKIVKEESAGSGIRRIYAQLEK
ncbi:alanine--tRNA ligase [Candidatus Amesbacteria bacterium RIFOXYB1_FULL_47_13]|nr:MAG: alanine--tRNA ligase [Candidatus Amesbacteria bacterium RIFOXYB1_FULL_47_13]HBC72280.1 alanine--tRNA ligase [Candidatus Amesbacteria bacterium]